MNESKDTGHSMATRTAWNGRWVCIGGGTAGLGFQLAQAFARRGANVAIVGRDLERGELAVEALRRLGPGTFQRFGVDLANENAIEGSEWKAWLHRVKLDVAIAAAGKSDRGLLNQLSTADLESMMRTNVYSSFCFSKATQESLKQGKGTLVHIASLAGIVAAPGMGGYSLAKHALVAMSRQLRIELVEDHIRVLLVCPGPIRRESTEIGRYDSLVSERNLPESLKKPAGGANLKAIDPVWLCDRIISAIESHKKELVVPFKVQWLASLSGLWPGLLDYMLKGRMSK
jgi:short-subunit dehydrogenase